MHFKLGCFHFLKKGKEERRKWKDVFCITHHGCVVKVGHMKFTFHASVPCLALMSLFYMYFASFSYVVHVVCELFIVFDHMILILKSRAFDCKD